MGHMTHHSEHTRNGSITCLSTDNYKRKRLRSLTNYKSLPRYKIVAEVTSYSSKSKRYY